MEEQNNPGAIQRPDREHPTIPQGAECQEVLDMIGNLPIRCCAPATAVVAWPREIYYMCAAHAWHSVRNRNARILAGTCGLAGLLPKYSEEQR